MKTKTKGASANGKTTTSAQQPQETNVQPGAVTPEMALQSIRNVFSHAVLFAWKDGTKTGLTLNDQVNLQQHFEIVKAALPK